MNATKLSYYVYANAFDYDDGVASDLKSLEECFAAINRRWNEKGFDDGFTVELVETTYDEDGIEENMETVKVYEARKGRGLNRRHYTRLVKVWERGK